jgi:serine phosphatase RsbU (regulator of sigma subunit)
MKEISCKSILANLDRFIQFVWSKVFYRAHYHYRVVCLGSSPHYPCNEWFFATGMTIGAMDDAPHEQKEIPLASGDLLILYTDGVTEAVNDKEEMFEIPRLMKIILASRSLAAQEIVEAIIRGVNDFSQNQPQYDDITLMVVKVR